MTSPKYTKLLLQTPPKVIRTEAENEFYLKALHSLEKRGDMLTSEEQELADLLTLLVEDFEERQYPLPKATPTEVLSFLMEQQAVGLNDLIDIFGDEEKTKAALAGNQDLSLKQVEALGRRLHVPPEVFFS